MNTAILTPLLLALSLALTPDEFADKRKAAGKDVEKLWELALWCESQEREEEFVSTLERILKIEPDHDGAHERLRHHSYDGKWFETYRALADYRRAEEAEKAALGLVRYGDGWAPASDVPFLRMGWERDSSGTWLDPVAHARTKREADLAAKGWQQQDLTWVSPDEFGPWRAGLYKCGAEWLDEAAADQWHATLGRGWELAGERFVVHATTDRESARWAVWWADQTYSDLVRAIGVEPAQRPRFLTLRDLAQYNALASGDATTQRPPAEVAGWSSLHYAFQADSLLANTPDGLTYQGGGVCYWAVDDQALAPYGQHAVRHAAALAYLDAALPSWDAISNMVVGGYGTPADTQAFWQEKKIPTWLWFGIASYCERYFQDANAADGQSPWWPREWALENLRAQGDLRPMEDIFEFALNTADVPDSTRMIHEAGLLVAFVLDGECEPVTEAHAALRELLINGAPWTETRAAATALEEALTRNERKLRRFAGL